MDKQIVFVYSHTLITKAAKRVWLRYYAPFYVFWIGVILFALAMFLISSNLRHLSHSEAFGLGLLAGALAVFVFQISYSYESIKKQVSLASKKLNNTEVVYTFDNQGIFTESSVGSANRFWRFFDRLWVKPDLWLLFYNNQNYLILPTHLLSADLQKFIIQKVTESGGKIEQ
jgi:hypothetical protein